MKRHNNIFSPRLLFTFAVGLLLAACDQLNLPAISNGNEEQSFDISHYQGKWVILNYWAEWCLPCLKEIPELNQLQQDHGDELAVIAVNFDRIQGKELTELAKRMGIRFEILHQDPADALRLSRPASLPTTYVFNREGKLSSKLVGPQTSAGLLSRTDIELAEPLQ